MTIDTSKLKALYINGKKVASLSFNGKKLKLSGGGGESSPLTFTAIDAPLNVELRQMGTPSYTPSLVYSTDNGSTWSDYTIGVRISVSTVGSNIMFKAKTTNAGFSTSNNDYYAFAVNDVWGQDSNKCKVSGNIMSLLDASMQSTTVGSYCFYKLFNGSSQIADASELELPATALADHCYYCMFKDCTSLASAPALPATTLADNCYGGIFQGCSSLTSAPELPATTIAAYCYFYMFQGCKSLTTAPALSATTLATNCYSNMFSDCSSLTAAPELPAETMVSNCYYSMFYSCKSLNFVKTNQTSFVSPQWLNGVAATGTFICPSILGTDETIRRGNSYCPNGWTVVNSDAS